MALLTVRDLSLGYDSHVVIEHLSFEVDPGDYLCVVDENGSGKTTLMRTILGLRRRIGRRPAAERGRLSAPADGDPEGLSGHGPGDRALRLPGPHGQATLLQPGGKGPRRAEPRAHGHDSLQKPVLPGAFRGQQQRVLLARALCATRRLLLLDEPVSGLDPKATAEMYALIEGLNREGVAIIMISHDVEAAMRYATRVLRVDGGRGETTEVGA